MKINQRKNHSKLLFAVIGVVVVGSAIAAAYFLSADKNTAINNQNLPENQNTNNVENPDQALVTDNTSNEGSSNSVNKALTPQNTSSSSIEKPDVTRAEQSGSYVRVSALFQNSSNGTCNAVFTGPNGQTVTKTAQIIVGPSYYACDGFRIDASEFSQKGTWKLKVSHIRGDQSSVSDEVSLSIQ